MTISSCIMLSYESVAVLLGTLTLSSLWSMLTSSSLPYIDKSNPYTLGKLDHGNLTLTSKDGAPMHTTGDMLPTNIFCLQLNCSLFTTFKQ